jgi:hypothetical protein
MNRRMGGGALAREACFESARPLPRTHTVPFPKLQSP